MLWFTILPMIFSFTVADYPPTMRLAIFLRDVLGLKGTKVSCWEGGCGACTVSATRYDPTTTSVRTFTVNAVSILLQSSLKRSLLDIIVKD